jgi:16S rRNA (cytosine1402-N4)-methyltransferase
MSVIGLSQARPRGFHASRPNPSERTVPPELTPKSSESEPGPVPEFASQAVHRAVLVDEVVGWLEPKDGAILVDGTVGAGGHASALGRRVGTTGRIIGLDRDPGMLALAKCATAGLPVTLVHAPYSSVREVLEELGVPSIQGIVLDLGLSSDQLAWTHRGFSFAADGPLDMRFDPDSTGPTAADLLAALSAEELAQMFFDYGEERFSRRIARRIVETRRTEPVQTTGQLSELIRQSVPGRYRHGPIDPATRVFQALRIMVNDELGHLDAVLKLLPEILAPGGRAVVISFHSLEDRRVKWAFRNDFRLNVLTKKPVSATAQEVAVNPRARSAKLRVAERCPNQAGTPRPNPDRPFPRT